MDEDHLSAPTSRWWRKIVRGQNRPLDTTEPEEDLVPAPWFADDAESEAAPRYGRADFLLRAREIIDEARVHSSSTVFGLVGPWGSGKSSMLEWLRVETSAPSVGAPWSIITFNPWDYPDANALQIGFFGTLRASFGGSHLEKARTHISELGVAVAPFTAAFAAFGLYDPSKLVESGSKLLGGNRSADAARRRLELTLRQTKRPVLVIIDDLDRISSDELLLTLKLIRQLGRLPYVHYLLSYDEATILDVLTQTSLIGDGGRSRARDYMEKVVQVRFDVPQLRTDDVLELVNQQLGELGQVTGQSLSGEGLSRFSAAYLSFMTDRLTTPRAIRRYFAQARSLSSRLRGEVDLSDFLILTWLRTFEPGVYSLIQARRARLVGAHTVDGYPRDAQERAKHRSDALEEWNRALADAGTRDEELANTLRAVAALFPRVAHVLDLTVGPSPAAPLRVANDEYFYRFFSAGISGRDIADSTVRKAIEDMESGAGERSVAVAKVKLALLELRTLTVSKLVRASLDATVTSPSTFAWLTRIYADEVDSSDLVRSAYRFEELISERLRKMTSDQALAALEAIGEANGGVLLANSVSRAMLESPTGARFAPTVAVQNLTTATMRNAIFADHSTAATLSVHLQVAANSWREVHPEGFRNWILDEAAVRGDLVALSFFVDLSQSLGASPEVHITRVDLETASRYLDLEAIRRRHASEISAARPAAVSGSSKVRDSEENRLLMVLQVLKTEGRP